MQDRTREHVLAILLLHKEFGDELELGAKLKLGHLRELYQDSVAAQLAHPPYGSVEAERLRGTSRDPYIPNAVIPRLTRDELEDKLRNVSDQLRKTESSMLTATQRAHDMQRREAELEARLRTLQNASRLEEQAKRAEATLQLEQSNASDLRHANAALRQKVGELELRVRELEPHQESALRRRITELRGEAQDNETKLSKLGAKIQELNSIMDDEDEDDSDDEDEL